MGNHCQICSFNCWGLKDNHASCCSIQERDFIIGPILDFQEFLDKLSNKLGRVVEFDEVFYSYETGSKTFPSRSVWQDSGNFPAFKVNFDHQNKYCINYNRTLRTCTVYDIRPETCQNYFCDFLERELLMNT